MEWGMRTTIQNTLDVFDSLVPLCETFSVSGIQSGWAPSAAAHTPRCVSSALLDRAEQTPLFIFRGSQGLKKEIKTLFLGIFDGCYCASITFIKCTD